MKKKKKTIVYEVQQTGPSSFSGKSKTWKTHMGKKSYQDLRKQVKQTKGNLGGHKVSAKLTGKKRIRRFYDLE